MSVGPTVLVAVPGLAGGVDEAARHLFGSPEIRRRWQVKTLTTKGQNGAMAPVVFALALLRLGALGLAGRVDLLHVNVSSRGSTVRKLGVVAVARLIGLPYVIQLHGGGFERFYRELPRPGRSAVRWFFAGAGQVFVLGQPFARLVRDEIGIDEDRIAIVRNAVTVPPEVQDHLRPVVSDGTDAAPMVLFTGRIGPGKGVPELLDALASLTEIPWRAVIVGDGEVDGTRARAVELGVGERIEVRGWQDRDRVSQLLTEASVFVLPSHLEALSVSLLEAMAQGLCCIATPVGAHGEIVVDEENGLLIAPGDIDALAEALRRALTDPELRSKLGAAARVTVQETCSTGVVAEQLSATYERMLVGG